MRRYAVPAVITAVAVVFLVVLTIGLHGQKANNSIAYSVASHHYKLAPDDHAQLPVLMGADGAKTRSLADYRGKVVLVNVFAPWCDGCSEEAAFLGQVQKLMVAHGGTVLGISHMANPGAAVNFMHEYHNTYPVLQDVGGNLGQAFNVATMPDSYVVNRDGKIQALNLYPLTMAWVKTNLLPILKQTT